MKPNLPTYRDSTSSNKLSTPVSHCPIISDVANVNNSHSQSSLRLLLHPPKWSNRKKSYIAVTLRQEARKQIHCYFGKPLSIGSFLIGHLCNQCFDSNITVSTPLKIGRRFALSITEPILKYLHYQPENELLLDVTRLVSPKEVGRITNPIEYVGRIMRWNHILVHHIPQYIRELAAVPQYGLVKFQLGSKIFYRRIATQFRIAFPIDTIPHLRPGDTIVQPMALLKANCTKSLLVQAEIRANKFWKEFDQFLGLQIPQDPSRGKPVLLAEILKELIGQSLIPNVQEVIATEEYVASDCRIDMVIQLKDGSREFWELKAHRMAHNHDHYAMKRLKKYHLKGIPITTVITLPADEVPSWVYTYSTKILTLENLMEFAHRSRSDSTLKKLELIRAQWPEFKRIEVAKTSSRKY